jgi:hypothetical protein
MIRWTGLAPWEVEFPRSTSTSRGVLRCGHPGVKRNLSEVRKLNAYTLGAKFDTLDPSTASVKTRAI